MSCYKAPTRGWRIPGIVFLVMMATLPGETHGQSQFRDFTRPFVVLDTGGHSAPVRSLLFPEDGRLISGGMDKLIQTWKVEDGRPTLASTIRPASWRGLAGVIYAMALSPQPDANGQRILAVGGYGLWSTSGNITLFRYPGDPKFPNGEVIGQLAARDPEKPDSNGHFNTVMTLAFSPDGRTLASGANDGQVLLWNVAERKMSAVLLGPGPEINKIAFRPDGLRLAAGGADGITRLFDVPNRKLLSAKSPVAKEIQKELAGDTGAQIILNLAFAPPGGQELVIGREGGQISIYKGDTLEGPRFIQKTSAERKGPVEALAISHDGKTLATAVVQHNLKAHGDSPRVDCEVQLWSLTDGNRLDRSFLVNNLTYALAFSPDDTRLAIAGGDRQGIQIFSLSDTKKPSLNLEGTGSSIWRVGFGTDSRTVGFSHAQESDPKATEYVGFRLQDQKITDVTDSNIQRGLRSWNGWKAEGVDPYTLKVTGPGRSFLAKVDPTIDRRWWNWSFIPPSVSHPKPCIAIATDTGIVIFRLDDGARTRAFAGHTSMVYDLAPSPDGMWLATGSADQTVRIWSLKHCDSLPSLGATFGKKPEGSIVVTAIEPGGFAKGIDLKVGDVVEKLAISGKVQKSLDSLSSVDRVPPGDRVEMIVRRVGEPRPFPVGTSRRDSPRLSLFVGEDREWVIWTPEGYYQTSVAGDRKYLGWHRNGPTIASPTDHFPAETFEKELRRPDVITSLINGDDPAVAFGLVRNQNADPGSIVAAQAPPIVTLTASVPRPPEAPIPAPAEGVTLRAQVNAQGGSQVASVKFLVDGREVAPATSVNPPADSADVSAKLTLHPGRQKVAVVAVNKDGKERVETIEVVAPVTAPKLPTLHVIAIGASGPFASSKYPEIPFADKDAIDLREFFTAPGGKPKFEKVEESEPIVDRAATAKSIRKTILALGEKVHDPNDAFVVILESHFLAGATDKVVVATDTDDSGSASDNLTADELEASLAKVAAQGCKVLLLLDTSHPKAPVECREGLTNFVRGLSRKNVITFVAANHGVSRRVDLKSHGAFAQAILDVFDARAISRPWIKADTPMSLDDFQDAVVARVKELTGRKQFAACYIPETLSSGSPIFEPNRAR